MRARDIMTSPVITVNPRTTIKEAARILATHGFTALPVVADDARLVGIGTEAGGVRGRRPPRRRRARGRRRPGPHPAGPPGAHPVRLPGSHRPGDDDGR